MSWGDGTVSRFVIGGYGNATVFQKVRLPGQAAVAAGVLVGCWSVGLTVAMAAINVVIAQPTVADARCAPGGPPLGAASKDVSDVYGQPATLWIAKHWPAILGITTTQGTGQIQVDDPSHTNRSALLLDAQQDGNHQIIVFTGRDALLYAVSGCTITPVADPQGNAPFVFDIDQRRGTGDGIGCSDLGDGRHLVGLLRNQDNGRLTVRRTEIDLNGATATIGLSDTVTATSDQDPAWTTARGISCGDLTMRQDGLEQPY